MQIFSRKTAPLVLKVESRKNAVAQSRKYKERGEVVIREIGLSSYRSIERRRASGTETPATEMPDTGPREAERREKTQHTNPTRPPLKGGEGEREDKIKQDKIRQDETRQDKTKTPCRECEAFRKSLFELKEVLFEKKESYLKNSFTFSLTTISSWKM